MLIDSHCHLDMFEAAERDDIVARAATDGVSELVTIGTRMGQSRQLIELVRGRDRVWCTVGVHPNSVGEDPLAETDALVALARNPKVVGIGESGLDYFYKRAPRDQQAESFRRHIRAARATGLPLVIHARDADGDIAHILQDEWEIGGPFTFLLHCFSSGRALAEAALALGGFVSFSGMLTFPKSTELRAIAADIPEDRLLVETDAPYLAPVPHRGKRNEPAFVVNTARTLAEVRGLSIEALGALTTANFRRLFSRTA
ncbi:MAG: TatD family hydrolase [Acetobacteraceae bacterium]|nr:TatD family hydrolase [Acetobacteraceae bacterium]